MVGGGPAGRVAARELARLGVRVLLLDEHRRLGGQYYKRRAGAVRAQAGDLRPRGTRLAAEVLDAGVDVCSETAVWGVDDDGRTLLTVHLGTPGSVRALFTVLATGAHERVLPVPGWQLPGVCTPGAALHLATIDRVAIGRRVVVAGSGPFLLPVAVALLDVGATVAAVCESGTPYRLDRDALRGLRHPARVAQFAGYRARLARAGVPVRQATRVAAVTGGDRVAAVHLATGAGTVQLDVDAVALGWGFRPNTELAALLGCRTEMDETTWDRLVVADDVGGTTREDVFVVGEAAGVAGVQAAVARAAVTASQVARRLGRSPSPTAQRRARVARRAATRAAAWTAGRFPVGAGSWLPEVHDDTVVCRCEFVTAAELRCASRTVLACGDPDAAKGATRAGMGPCQGRQCFPAVAVLTGGGVSAFPVRMPVRPVSVAAVAAGSPIPADHDVPAGPADTAPSAWPTSGGPS